MPGPDPAGRRAREPAIRIDSEEIDARANIAEALYQAGVLPLARAEFAKILVIQPDHIQSRIRHAEQVIAEGRFERPALGTDLGVVLNHPGLEEYIPRPLRRGSSPCCEVTAGNSSGPGAPTTRDGSSSRSASWRSSPVATSGGPTTIRRRSMRCSARRTPPTSRRRPASSSGPSSPIRTSCGGTGIPATASSASVRANIDAAARAAGGPGSRPPPHPGQEAGQGRGPGRGALKSRPKRPRTRRDAPGVGGRFRPCRRRGSGVARRPPSG